LPVIRTSALDRFPLWSVTANVVTATPSLVVAAVCLGAVFTLAMWLVLSDRQVTVGAAAPALVAGIVVTALLVATVAFARRASDSENQFRTLLEAAPDAMIIADPQGRIAMVNARTEYLFGYDRDELIDADVELLFPRRYLEVQARRAGAPRAPEERARSMGGGGLTLYGVDCDGSEVPIEVSLSPLDTPGGRFVIAAIRDVSARIRTEHELQEKNLALQQSNQELERFAYVASHDLQEPLRMVTAYTQLLARRYKGRLGTDADEFIGFAVDGATRMGLLISGLLELARVTSKGRPFAEVDVSRVLEHTLATLDGPIREQQAAVIIEPLPKVLGDDVQLGQIFQNLIGNALKFRRESPPIVLVRAERVDTDWCFAVEDNGIGIAEEHRDRIFQVFQRLHTRSEYEGTGIGLAICRRVVERHGGRIWVEGRVDGTAGSRFVFTVPAIELQQAA
jgi:PAS domain S-box-containing protein